MKLELVLNRIILTDQSTIGELRQDNSLARICYTLEDKVREDGVKVYGKTAIPAGRYQVRMTFSNRFQRLMPLLMDVPMFTGIRLHGGNTPENTLGCPLLGMNKHSDADRIYNCKPALDAVYTMIAAAEMTGGSWITICNPVPPDHCHPAE